MASTKLTETVLRCLARSGDGGYESTAVAVPMSWSTRLVGTAPALILLSGCGAGVAGIVGAFEDDSTPSDDPGLSVVSITPAPGTNDVDRDTPVVVQFNTDVDETSVTEASFTVTTPQSSSTETVRGVRRVSGGRTVTFTPEADWPILARIDVTMSTEVRSESGRHLAVDFTSSFDVREGAWVATSPPTDTGACVDVEALATGEVFALVETVPGELSVFERIPGTDSWMGPTPLVTGAISASAHLSAVSHTSLVSRNSLAVSDGGQVSLVTSIDTGSGVAIVATSRVSPGVWSSPETVLDAQPAAIAQVESVYRLEELNAAWFDTRYRSRRRVGGTWEPIEEIGANAAPTIGSREERGPVNRGIDLSSTTTGALHVAFGSPPRHKSKVPGEAAWPTGSGSPIGLPDFVGSLQIQAFDNGSALAVAAAFDASLGTGVVESSILIPSTSNWTSLGASASLNLAIGGDGFFTNALLAGRPSGDAILALMLNVETEISVGVNRFEPFGWQFGEVLAGPYISPPRIDDFDVAAGVDVRGNGVAMAVDTVQDRIHATRFLVADGTWSSIPELNQTSGTGCINNPRLTPIGVSGEFFALVNVECANEQVAAIHFR